MEGDWARAVAGTGGDGGVGPGLEEREDEGRDDEPILRGWGVSALEEILVGEQRRQWRDAHDSCFAPPFAIRQSMWRGVSGATVCGRRRRGW